MGIYINKNGTAKRADGATGPAGSIKYDGLITGFGDDLQESTDNLINDLGTVELGNTVSTAHAAGDFFLWKGQMVKCTMAIGAGGAITLGTNVEGTDILEVLAAVNSNLDARVKGSAFNKNYKSVNRVSILKGNNKLVLCSSDDNTWYEVQLTQQS